MPILSDLSIGMNGKLAADRACSSAMRSFRE
jgi:hypothetical protein